VERKTKKWKEQIWIGFDPDKRIVKLGSCIMLIENEGMRSRCGQGPRI